MTEPNPDSRPRRTAAALLQTPRGLALQLTALGVLGLCAGFAARATTSPNFERALAADVEEATAEQVRAALAPTDPAPPTDPETPPASVPAAPTETTEPTAPMTVDFLTFRTELFEKPNVTLIDARDEGSYLTEHIPGALHLDAETVTADPSLIGVALEAVPKSQVLVTYCSGGDCDLSLRLARLLTGQGYRRVFVFEGGITQWQDEGEPTAQPGQEAP